jgi:hypothetical protein
MRDHFMVDLESLGLRPNVVVVSIGVVRFNAEGIVSEFYERIDMQEQVELGRSVDPGSVQWWAAQSEQARAELASYDRSPVEDALVRLRQFSHVGNNETGPLWGYGAAFDNAVLRDLYRDFDVGYGWSYRQDLCFRTVTNMAGFEWLEFEGTEHHALDDARNQAKNLIAYNNEIGGLLL